MDFIKPDPLFKFNSDTLVSLRTKYNYGKPGEMDAAVDVLEDWIKKQDHFTKKDYSREYLERSIILQKGSVERAKKQIDAICTMRTLLPKFFEVNLKELDELKCKIAVGLLPNMTKDHYRVFNTKFVCPSSELNPKILFTYYKFGCMLWEYMKEHDYCDGAIFCGDLRGLNIVELVTKVNIVEAQQLTNIALGGFKLRLKALHILSESSTVNVLVALLKQLLSKKVAERVHVHKTPDSLYEFIPREILTSEMGGDAGPTSKLHSDYVKLWSEEENLTYLKEMSKARTNEALRQSGKFNEEYMGVAGSFRCLSVD